MIHWEMCKKFKFDHTNKWYKHNPASVQEKGTHKLPWDFDKQTDHLTSARRPDLIIINKKKELAKLWTLLSRLIRQPVKENKNTEFKPVLLCLKIDLESYPTYDGRVK